MKKILLSGLALGVGLVTAAPAHAYWIHFGPAPRAPRTKVVCDWQGCRYRFKQPKIRLNQHCVYKPWKDRTICRY